MDESCADKLYPLVKTSVKKDVLFKDRDNHVF